MRNVLEEISKGSSITDTILVPLMQANKFDVTGCVDALLELINGQGPCSIAREQRELDQELEFLRQCQMEASQEGAEQASLSDGQSEDEERGKAAISAELKRAEELELRRREVEAEEKKHFALMRRELESEWMARLEQQQQELAAKQQQLEAERHRMLEKQLLAVSQQRSAEFKQQVEEALKRRMAESATTAAVSVATPEPAPSGVAVELTCPDTAEMGSLMTVYWEYKQGR